MERNPFSNPKRHLPLSLQLTVFPILSRTLEASLASRLSVPKTFFFSTSEWNHIDIKIIIIWKFLSTQLHRIPTCRCESVWFYLLLSRPGIGPWTCCPRRPAEDSRVGGKLVFATRWPETPGSSRVGIFSALCLDFQLYLTRKMSNCLNG